MSYERLILICHAFMAAGAMFCFASAVGLLRFPDVFSRLHASTKGLTGGLTLMLIGAAPISGSTTSAVKILLIAAFYLATNPLSSHAIARACRKRSLKSPETVLKQDSKNGERETSR